MSKRIFVSFLTGFNVVSAAAAATYVSFVVCYIFVVFGANIFFPSFSSLQLQNSYNYPYI